MNELFNPSFILQLIIGVAAAAATGGGIYIAIRIDLVRALHLAQNAIDAASRASESAARAHERVDDMFMERNRNK